MEFTIGNLYRVKKIAKMFANGPDGSDNWRFIPEGKLLLLVAIDFDDEAATGRNFKEFLYNNELVEDSSKTVRCPEEYFEEVVM